MVTKVYNATINISKLTFVSFVGPIHQLDTEISAILVEHGIPESQASRGFGEACMREMPTDSPESPWKPTPVSEITVWQCSFGVSNIGHYRRSSPLVEICEI